MDDRTPTERGTQADLARRVAELETTVARLTAALEARPAPPGPALADLLATFGHGGSARPSDPVAGAADATTPGSDAGSLHGGAPAATPGGHNGTGSDDAADGRVDRRRLITRAGAVAAGAVLGGAAATVATASPAAAATGSFDTATSTPAVTATSTGTGAAVKATNSAAGNSGNPPPPALEVTGRSTLNGAVSISGTDPTVRSFFTVTTTNSFGMEVTGEFFALIASSKTNALVGDADAGVGVIATSQKSLGLFAYGPLAAVQLANTNPSDGRKTVPSPIGSTERHSAGELVFDINNNLWVCVGTGTPGTWRRLAAPSTSGALTVLPSPVRVYDSRPGQPPFVAPQTKLPANTPRTGIALTTASSGIPTDATAAILTATVANTAGGSPSIPGFLTIYPSGIATPITSNLNWTTPGAVTANATTVALGPNATIAAFANYTTDLIIDAIAYYR